MNSLLVSALEEVGLKGGQQKKWRRTTVTMFTVGLRIMFGFPPEILGIGFISDYSSMSVVAASSRSSLPGVSLGVGVKGFVEKSSSSTWCQLNELHGYFCRYAISCLTEPSVLAIRFASVKNPVYPILCRSKQ